METAYRLLTTEWKAPKYLLDPWLPAGFHVLLVGPSDVGKSLFRTNLACVCAGGKRFLGYRTNACRVLIYQWENTTRQESERLKKMFPPQDRIGDVEDILKKIQFSKRKIYFGSSTKASLSKIREDLIGDFRQAELENGLVVFDCLSNLGLKDENSASCVRPALDILTEAAEEFSATTLLVHHEGKGNSSCYRGSSTIEGWAQHILRLNWNRGGLRELSFPKLKEERLPSISLKLQPNLWFVRSGSATTIDANRVVSLLIEFGNRIDSKRTLCELLMSRGNLTWKEAEANIALALRMGKVEAREAKGKIVYYLTERGKRSGT